MLAEYVIEYTRNEENTFQSIIALIRGEEILNKDYKQVGTGNTLTHLLILVFSEK